MIDFTQETYASLRQEMLDRVPDTYDKRDTAPIPTAISPAAYTLAGFYLTLDRVQRAAFVQTAVGDSLDMLAVIGGLTRYPASAAVRLGVFNTSVPIGARFSTINGAGSINFTVTAATDTGNQYQLAAETPGAIGNEYTGPILPITAIPGLTSAQITDILVPGDDTETDSAFRERLIEALNNRPFGGNIADYRQNVLAIDGVGGVQVYPTWSGGGTVKLSVLGADFLPGSSTLVEKVQNAIDPPPNQGLGLGLAPIGAKVTGGGPDRVGGECLRHPPCWPPDMPSDRCRNRWSRPLRHICAACGRGGTPTCPPTTCPTLPMCTWPGLPPLSWGWPAWSTPPTCSSTAVRQISS